MCSRHLSDRLPAAGRARRQAPKGSPHRLPQDFRFVIALAGALGALLLQGCGGGGGGSGDPVAAVSNVTVDRLSYGRLSTFTVSGSNLSTAVVLSATGCDGLVVAPGGTAVQQLFSCTPNQALSVRVAASMAGAEIFSSTALVPKPQVTLTTTLGTVVVELEPAVVKLTVDNFLAYVNASFYTNTIFHRVIPGFVVQGGGFTGVSGSTLTAQTGLRAAIALESNKGLSNTRGTIAMARSNAADTATSQFYFNSVNNAGLDYANSANPGYAVFGRIVSDLAVIDAMSAVSTRTVGTNADVPVTNIVVQTATQTK